MLRITETANVLQYFRAALSREDYYAQGSEFPGVWYGKLASKLELEGQVAQEDFHAICQNLHPTSGEKLKPRNRKDAVSGWDFTVSVPKSVSLLYGLTQDKDILDAFHEASYAMLDAIESDIRTRVRTHGRSQDRTTQQMLTALFVHTTSRPVNGTEDPHLHGHAWIPNITFDAEEERYKAAKMRYVWENAPYYEALFDKEMMTGLRELGYGIEQSIGGWEIAGISRDTIDKFSRRTKQIEQVASEKNILSDQIKDTLGVRTRGRKREDIDADTLQDSWWQRLSEDEKNTIARILDGPDKPLTQDPPISPQKAVEYACNICLKRKTMMSDKRIIANALNYAKGWLGEKALMQALKESVQSQNLHIIHGSMGQTLLTLPGYQNSKQTVRSLMKEGLNSCKALDLTGKPFSSAFLTEKQQQSLRKFLSSNNRILQVDTEGSLSPVFMHEAFEAVKRSGKQIFTFSPTPLPGMRPIQSLYETEAFQDKLQDQIVWIDRAQKLGVGEMEKLLSLTKKQDARVILSSSSYEQFSKRGDGMKILEPLLPKRKAQTPPTLPKTSQNSSQERAIMAQRMDRLSLIYAHELSPHFPMTR